MTYKIGRFNEFMRWTKKIVADPATKDTPKLLSDGEETLPEAGQRSSLEAIPPAKTVSDFIAASLARSEAQIAAGQTVPLEPLLDRLRASISRMQTDEKPKTPSSKG